MPTEPSFNQPVHTLCPSCGRPSARCSECGKKFYAQRVDALTCSQVCRTARSRRLSARRAKGQKVES